MSNQFQLDRDKALDALLIDCDDTYMPMPLIEDSPHLLISKVRKHYFEHTVKLLCVNYENYQKLLGKNIHLPSAIWKCAKFIELYAAQSCMVAQLYRKNIVKVIAELKTDTRKGKLNKKLREFIQKPSDNEKRVQTSEVMCDCYNKNRKKKRSNFSHPKDNNSVNEHHNMGLVRGDVHNTDLEMKQQFQNSTFQTISGQKNTENKNISVEVTNTCAPGNTTRPNKLLPEARMSIESQESTEDTVMKQLEQLFKSDADESDIDLFEGTVCDDFDLLLDHKSNANKPIATITSHSTLEADQAARIKSLDERLALIESSGILAPKNTVQKEIPPSPKHKKTKPSKWLCEAYYQKLYLFEKLDDIRENNRKKYSRLQLKYLDLFGEESEEDQIMSPLEETTEFVLSCKQRIAPWLVKILNPYYVNGRIKGKALFKSLAKHLTRIIYQCSKYPSEYEVQSFVSDFLKSHKMIRCEADFKEFRIENLDPI